MNAELKRAASQLERLFYPPRCACCNRVIAHRALICEECQCRLPRVLGEICGACGREKDFCSNEHQFEFIQCVAPFYYVEPIRQGIHGLKFAGRRKSAAYFGMEMAQTVRQRLGGIRFDLVTSVPLSVARQAERGFNQSALLAAQVADCLGLSFLDQALCKIFDNKPQHSQSQEERRGNVLGVYEACPEWIRDKRILLVDDIETTGSTLNECAKMLRLRGSGEVYALTACIALRHRDVEKLQRLGRFSSCISTDGKV